MTDDLIADIEFIRNREVINLRRRDFKGRIRLDVSLMGRPVIAVGDLAAYESCNQAAHAFGISGESVRRAVAWTGYYAYRRPWMLASPPLMRAIITGGWDEACRLGLVPRDYQWAVKLGRLLQKPKGKMR